MGSSEFNVIRCNSNIENKYLFELLNSQEVRNIAETNMTGSSGHRRVPAEFYSSIKIPIPPKKVQEKIVAECKTVDIEKEKAETQIEEAKGIIEIGFKNAFSKANKTFKLSSSDDFEAFIGRRVLKKEIDTPEATIPIFSANVFDPFGKIDRLFIKEFTQPSVLWGIDGDWMVNYIPKNYQFYPTDHCGVIRIKTKEVNPRYLTWALNEAGKEKRFSRSHRASTDRIKGISIQVPDIKIQNELEKEIIKQEKIIKNANKIIESITERKQAILKKHL